MILEPKLRNATGVNSETSGQGVDKNLFSILRELHNEIQELRSAVEGLQQSVAILADSINWQASVAYNRQYHTKPTTPLLVEE